jgi:uncharacterized membrane protein YfcA
MFPIAVVVATLANSSGFSGGVLFQPIYNLVLHVPLQNAVATGIATETLGMTSGAARYVWNKMVELPIAFTMLMLVIPGVVIGNHALMVLNPNVVKIILGVVIFALASIQLVTAAMRLYGKRKNVPVEDIYPFMWIPPVAGFFSATTGTGIAEISQPLLERGLKLTTKRANATAILVEAAGDWIITILNLHAGLISLDIIVFTVPGAMIGAQLGAWVSKYLPDRLLKIIFSAAIMVIGVFYVGKGIQWLLG